jgi:hypothetical protein
MARYFRCSRTGVLFPPDYVEQWGRKYGIGLGSTPISEALVNCYESGIGANPRDPMLSMFPIAVCRAQVDLVDIADVTGETMAIIAIDDPDMVKRSEIMRGRQRDNNPEMSRIYNDVKGFKPSNAVQSTRKR